jgi:aconitate hydratase
MESSSTNPFSKLLQEHEIAGKQYKFYNLTALGDKRYEKLPYSIRVLLESAIRNCDNFNIQGK